MFALELVARRFLLAVLTLLVVSGVVFAMVEVLPGDVASRILGRMATDENLAVLRARLNLDVPAIQRYGQWLFGMIQGDFGTSLTTDRPVLSVLGPRIVNTLILAGFAFILYIPLALVPAAIQALNRDRPLDHGISIATLVLFSTPDFLLATLLLLLFVLVFPILERACAP
ncbi:MAG: ABC transporter permease [Rhodospirillaceae bacterium]|nr:ABC transporter permease [Rhodospirillaceae bacterium]